MRLILLLVPIVLFSSDFVKLIKSIDNNLLVKSSQKQESSYKKLYRANSSKNYPKVDMLFNYVQFEDDPTMAILLPDGSKSQPMPVSSKINNSGEIRVSYPIFSGYAITHIISKSKLEFLKSKLKTSKLKRDLYTKIAYLYSKSYSVNKKLKALQEAKKAIESSYQKAKSLREVELISQSDLFKIESKKYEILSEIESAKNQAVKIKNQLYYISNAIVEVKSLPKIPFKESLNSISSYALKNRKDLKLIKTDIDIVDEDIKIIQSKYYPNISLIAGIKRVGDDLSLNGDGFSNANKNYISAIVKWNIFDGLENTYKKEALRYKKNSLNIFLQDYEKMILFDIKNAFSELNALKYKLKAAKSSLEASKSYLKLTKGRYLNRLTSADELSRAIADNAGSKAYLESIKADIFYQKCIILLLAGNDKFLNYFSHSSEKK